MVNSHILPAILKQRNCSSHDSQVIKMVWSHDRQLNASANQTMDAPKYAQDDLTMHKLHATV